MSLAVSAAVGKERVGLHFYTKESSNTTMAKKLYVGGLPYSTTEDQLSEAFAQAGAVESSAIIIDKMTNRSKGFGFVEMASDAEAQAAIDMWNGKEFGGRTLTVNEARPKEDRPMGGGNRGGYGAPRREMGRNW